MEQHGSNGGRSEDAMTTLSEGQAKHWTRKYAHSGGVNPSSNSLGWPDVPKSSLRTAGMAANLILGSGVQDA